MTMPTPMADKLLQAFQLFNERTVQFEEVYCRLSKRLYQLNRHVVRENRHLQEALLRQVQSQRAQRIDAMGEMAVKIAQEVRNSLGSMELFASLLQQELDQDAEAATLVAHILSGVKNLNHVISNMLLVTKRPTPRLAPVNPHPLLEAALVFAEHLVRHQHLCIRKDFGAAEVSIEADAELVKQVFLNLILNAIQAMPQGGTLTLTTCSQGGMLEIQVSDTGVGIAPEMIEHIFNPFFTTKERAIGLGLTLVHHIMEAHRGVIQVNSAPGRGATVTLSFPQASITTEPLGGHAPTSE